PRWRSEVRRQGWHHREVAATWKDERMKTTRYFAEQVLRRRPYLRTEWCVRVVRCPDARAVQPDGRIRHWGQVAELGGRVLRVITLADGETIHNAFPDRDFRSPQDDGEEDA